MQNRRQAVREIGERLWLLMKATDIASKKKKVQHPGSKGGKGYWDEHGDWQYGAQPKKKTPVVNLGDYSVAGMPGVGTIVLFHTSKEYIVKNTTDDGNIGMVELTPDGQEKGDIFHVPLKYWVSSLKNGTLAMEKFVIPSPKVELPNTSVSEINEQEQEEEEEPTKETPEEEAAMTLPKVGEVYLLDDDKITITKIDPTMEMIDFDTTHLSSSDYMSYQRWFRRLADKRIRKEVVGNPYKVGDTFTDKSSSSTAIPRILTILSWDEESQIFTLGDNRGNSMYQISPHDLDGVYYKPLGSGGFKNNDTFTDTKTGRTITLMDYGFGKFMANGTGKKVTPEQVSRWLKSGAWAQDALTTEPPQEKKRAYYGYKQPEVGDVFIGGMNEQEYTVTGKTSKLITLSPKTGADKKYNPEQWQYEAGAFFYNAVLVDDGRTFNPPLARSGDDKSVAAKKRVCAKLYEDLYINKDFWQAAQKLYIPKEFVVWNKSGVSGLEAAESPGRAARAKVYLLVDKLINQWAVTSADTTLTSQALQRAVRDEFKIEGSWDSLGSADYKRLSHIVTEVEGRKIFLARLDEEYSEYGAAYRAFMRSQYNQTQSFLKSHGKKTLTLYRGVANTLYPAKLLSLPDDKGGLQEVGMVQLQPQSSFTTHVKKALDFGGTSGAGLVYRGVFPAERIISTALSGVGCLEEHEVTVLGGKPESMAAFHASDFRGYKYMKPDVSVSKIGPSLTALWKSDNKDTKNINHLDELIENADWAKGTPDLGYGKILKENLVLLGVPESHFASLPSGKAYVRAVTKSTNTRDLNKAQDTPASTPLPEKAPAPQTPAAPEKKKPPRAIPEGARWITVHGHGGDGEGGHPILIMPAQGKKNTYHVIGGAGGKLTHMQLHLKSPEEWAKHSKENAQKRRAKEKESGVGIETKAAITQAKQESSRLYVHRVAEQMGWKDYQDKSTEDFLAQTNGNKAQAALLAHQYLRSYITKANESVKGLRNRLTIDQHALAGANLRIDTSNDPYLADDTDLVPGDISQRLSESQRVGNQEAAENYQNALNSLSAGDTAAAIVHLTAGNKAAGLRHLTLQDVLPKINVSPPSGEERIGKQAKDSVQSTNVLEPKELDKRIALVSDKVQNGDNADKYIGGLELDALTKAKQAAGADPTHTDMAKAATYYLQAEKYRALRQKFGTDMGKFSAWQEMHERAQANAAAVAAIKNQGKFGAADVDPDVEDMSKARDLLAAKVLYDERIKRLRQAQKSMDPNLINSTVGEKDSLETDTNWNDVYDKATQKAFEQVQQSRDTLVAATLDTSIDDPTAFLQGVGDGEPIDQQRLHRYVAYGQQSAVDLIGQTVGGQEMLPRSAYTAMGVKAASKLFASYLASTRTPEEFSAIRDGVANYHVARETDVANGALIAANKVIVAAKEYKREEDSNVDNLYEAAKYNKLRMESVDHALATIGTAYGELNATAELNFAMMSAKPGAQNLVIDSGGKDVGQMVNLAHALNLGPEDYRLTDEEKDSEGEVDKPRGMELTPTGVKKLFHEAAPAVLDRRKKLMDIRAGKQDDLLPDGSRAANGWLPPYFAQWPASLWKAKPAAPVTDSAEIEQQQLTDPKGTTKAAAYALGKQPYGVLAFKGFGDLQPDDFKLVRAYFASHTGVPVSAENGTTDEANPHSHQTDIFGQPMLSQHAAGLTDDKSTQGWKDFVGRVGMERATSMVLDAIKGDFLNSFAPVYSSLANQQLQVTEVPTAFKNANRISIGKQAEAQLAPVIDKLAWRYPGAMGDAGNAIPGVNMSGKYVKQQRVIKALLASGGLNGKEGGRLGALLGPGAGKSGVMIGALTHAMSEGKARGGMIAEPSAVQGQMGQTLNGMIDPDAPFKWSVTTGMTREQRNKALADPNTHLVVLSHEQVRDDSIDALAKLWGTDTSEATKKFMGMERGQRAAAMKQAYKKAGWEHRLDYYAVDEAHVLANRGNKANSVLSNVSDAISDNSKYFMPATGTPLKNSVDEDADFLARLRPDEYGGKKQKEFVGRNSLLSSEVERLQQDREMDVAAKNKNRNWINNAAAQALQYELTPNIFTGSAYIKSPVTHTTVPVDLKDEPDSATLPKSDGTLHGHMLAGLQKSAYDRVGELEQNIKAATLNKDWPSVAKAIREISTADYKQEDGSSVTRNAFTNDDGSEIQPGSPEEAEAAKNLTKATGMMRDAAYNRILHTMPSGNMKTKALVTILDTLGKQDSADDNQPKGEDGLPEQDPTKRTKGKPVIIFTRSLDAVDNLKKVLEGKGYSVESISGRDSGKDKIAKKGLFQPSGSDKPKVNVLVLSDAMSAGIDLPRAEAVIHYDTPDTSKGVEQRSARAVRLSTKHPVGIYNIVTKTPYEKRRVDRVRGKGALGDVTQNPADVLDDSGPAKFISDVRSLQARKAHEAP